MTKMPKTIKEAIKVSKWITEVVFEGSEIALVRAKEDDKPSVYFLFIKGPENVKGVEISGLSIAYAVLDNFKGTKAYEEIFNGER